MLATYYCLFELFPLLHPRCFSMIHSAVSSPGRRVLAWSPHQTPRHNLHFLFLLRLETPFVTWSPTSPADSFGWRQVWGRNYSSKACYKTEKLPFGLASFSFLGLTCFLSFLTCIFCQLFEWCLLALMTPTILLLSHASFPWHFSSAFATWCAAFPWTSNTMFLNNPCAACKPGCLAWASS